MSLCALVAMESFAPGQREAYITQEQAREVAAEFMGLDVGKLGPDAGMPRWEASDLAPLSYRFVPVSEGPQTRTCVMVNAAVREVGSVVYGDERRRRGTKHLSPDQGRPIALRYVKEHWAHYDESVMLDKEERDEDPPHVPPDYRRVPTLKFRWVLEEEQVQVGHAMVHVNATTGKVVMYGQWYYSAKGLEPARLTPEQAQQRAKETLRARTSYPGAYTLSGDPYLRTRWHKGRPRLVWMVIFKETGSIDKGMPPRGLPAEVEIEAVTGEVVTWAVPA